MLPADKAKQLEALKSQCYDAIIKMNEAQAIANDESKVIESLQRQIKELENEKTA